MKNVRELLGAQGAVGEAFYIATPICCPSRTETLSGRLYHNVLTDDLSGCMHVDSIKYIFNHSSSLFPQLQSAGYLTGGFGKVCARALFFAMNCMSLQCASNQSSVDHKRTTEAIWCQPSNRSRLGLALRPHGRRRLLQSRTFFRETTERVSTHKHAVHVSNPCHVPLRDIVSLSPVYKISRAVVFVCSLLYFV